MAVSAFALTAYQTRSRVALRAALNFAITNTIGAFLVLIGIALLYSRTGALNLARSGGSWPRRPPRPRDEPGPGHPPGRLPHQAAVVPFHFWLVDTATSGPIPLAMILAGALDALGVYAVARIYWTIFATPLSSHHQAIRAVLIGIGVLSAAVGAVLALSFRDPRRRLAFVMVAHTGILLIGIGCLTARGVAASAVYAVGDGTVKAALFVGIALLGPAATAGWVPTGPREPSGHPVPTAPRVPNAPPLPTGPGPAGSPPGGGPMRPASAARTRAGLVLVRRAAWRPLDSHCSPPGSGRPPRGCRRSGRVLVGDPIIVLVAALTGAAVLDIAHRAARVHRAAHARPAGASGAAGGWVGAAGCGIALLALSAAAAWIGRWAAVAGSGFVDTAGYQARVLSGLAITHPGAPAAVGLSRGGTLLDGAAVAGAILLALALGRPTVRNLGRFPGVASVRAAARRLHDGSIGDSATWATLGTAAIAVVFAVSLH